MDLSNEGYDATMEDLNEDFIDDEEDDEVVDGTSEESDFGDNPFGDDDENYDDDPFGDESDDEEDYESEDSGQEFEDDGFEDASEDTEFEGDSDGFTDTAEQGDFSYNSDGFDDNQGFEEQGEEGYYDENSENADDNQSYDDDVFSTDGSEDGSDEFENDFEERQHDDALMREYEASFTGEEKAAQALKLTSDAFTRSYQRIKLSEILIPESLKAGRASTMTGLTAITKDLGVLVPIHVKVLPEESQDEDGKYVLLDGLRRMFGALKNQQEYIDAIVWEFKNDEVGSDYSLFISMLLNRTQKRSWGEIWDLFQILELQSTITPGTLEYLLDLKPGEAMRLRDVMLCNYDDVKEALLTDQKTLDAAYKMLAKKRKEENMLDLDDSRGIDSTVEGAESLASGNAGSKAQLSDEDVRELLDMSNNLDISDDAVKDLSFGDIATSDYAEQQQVGDRHPLPKELREAVLARDKFTCACCGMKMTGARLGLIAVHHKIPVHCSGKDLMENLITLCVNCHIALHTMERMKGSILMSEEDWNELYVHDEEGNIVKVDGKPQMSPEQLSLLKAQRLAMVAIDADARNGKTRQDVYDATSDAMKHPMPNTAYEQGKQDYIATKAK